MKCPKCKQEQPDGLSLCSGCGLDFEEWTAQPAGAAAAARAAPGGGMGTAMYVAAGVVMLGAVFGIVHAVRNKPPPRVIDLEPARPDPAPRPQPEPQGPPPVPKDAWRFEGVVTDLYWLKPVAGATVIFSKTMFPDLANSAKTDLKGRYLVDVPAREGTGYYAIIAHKDYRGNFYIDATKRDLPKDTWEARVNAGRQTMNFGPNYNGKAGQSVTFHFAIVPKNLSEEDEEKVNAVPRD